MSHCPGQDRRFWTHDDISVVKCPACGTEVEFFKDDGRRKCPDCGTTIKNPRVLLGCASWCAFAEDCVGISSGESGDNFESLAAALIHWLRGRGELDQDAAKEMYEAGLMGDEISEESSLPLSAIKLSFILCRYLSFRKQEDPPDKLLPEIEGFLCGYAISDQIISAAANLVTELYEEWPADGKMDIEYLKTLLRN